MRMVVLTGAGISAESGLATFRDSGGLWEGHDPMDVATPEAFAADPALVQRFYDERRAALASVRPNAAHLALGRLGRALGDELYLVTQNIDDLHERGGSPQVHHLHGELLVALCAACGERFSWTGPLQGHDECPGCRRHSLRPDVVWFGEMPYGLAEIEQKLLRCELFVAIGTSGEVYPAAGFRQVAAAVGADTLEINLRDGHSTKDFDDALLGPATAVVPRWVDDLLAG